MKIDCKNSIKKLLQSFCRITLTLAIIIGLPALAYSLWSPGSDEPLTKLNNNAIWLGHGWLGDDSWFHRNKRDVNNFRNTEKITELFRKLSENKISTVYPHLCPAQLNGNIAPYDSGQIERFLDLAAQYNIKVIPWISGVFEEIQFSTDFPIYANIAMQYTILASDTASSRNAAKKLTENYKINDRYCPKFCEKHL